MSGRACWLLGCTVTCFLAAGCAHSTIAKDDDTPASTKSEAKTEAKSETKTKHQTDSAKAVPRRVRSSDRAGAPVLATSPAGLLQPKAIGDIQDALASRGLLDDADKSGALDEKTKQALRQLQSRNGLPATGLPDDATVRKLGLDPGKVFVVSDGGPK